ncbi:olfactory receptor 7D11-like [Thomomys bottae]
MEGENHTSLPQFLLLGLSDDPELQSMLFGLFLSMYLITVFGNLLIILAVTSDPHLHTPMYFFLSNLSFTDICLSTTTIPKMLVNLHTRDQSITHQGCLLQVCLVWNFAFLENCLLAVMAYDRFVAICHPLSYTVTMSPRLCALLILFSVLISVMSFLLMALMATHLSFCQDVEIPHFFCELAQVIKLACSDTFVNNILTYTATFLCAGIPLGGIIFSYSQIGSSVLKLSVRGRRKAFSTCGSHLCVVCLFYGAGLGVYISSAVTDSPRKSAVASVMYSVVPQMLNPFIYSLRNRDMKGALRRLAARVASLCSINNMNPRNISDAEEFFLLGLSGDLELQPILFGLFLSIYLVTVLGNLLIILAISYDPHLHTPMFFFLSTLSVTDVCFISTTIPKMLANLQTQNKSISYPGCLTQICFVLLFAGLENGILIMMAYDRFVAICHPLRYNVIMNPKFCGMLITLSFLISFLDALLHTLMALRLSFCPHLEIPHFFCELAHLLKLACSPTLINNILVYVVTGLLGVIPVSGIVFSYIQIISSVLKIPSAGGKHKAFSTCVSHLIIVSLFYGTGFGVYLSSMGTHSDSKSAIASVMYTVVTPMMNPFIYSLRNKDMVEAVRKLTCRIVSFH